MSQKSKQVGIPLSETLPTSPRKNFLLQNPIDRNIYWLLKEQGPMTQPDLVLETGMSRSTLFDILTRLMISGLVGRFSEPRKTRGVQGYSLM
ncbi:MAG: helix-turn-helix transcriptional regulator [Candidatus Hodarchaeota archaeon]